MAVCALVGSCLVLGGTIGGRLEGGEAWDGVKVGPVRVAWMTAVLGCGGCAGEGGGCGGGGGGE